MNRRNTTTLLIIVAAAGLFRLAFSTLVVGWDAPIRGDEIDYHSIATSLDEGEGYRIDGYLTCRRPPVYPLVLAGAYKLFGPGVTVARILQVILGMLLVYLVFRVARRFFDTNVGLIAAAIAALNPFLILMSGYLLTENIYMVLVMTALLVVPGPGHISGALRAVLTGVVLIALATLARPTGLPLALWMLGTAVVFGSGWSVHRIRNGLIAAALFAAILLPWSIRNQSVAGGWVGLTTHGGITFYQGNNQKVVDIPHYRGGVAPLDGLPYAAEIARMGELERERFTREKGMEFLRSNKRLLPRLMWWKFARFWRLKSESGLSGIKSGWWWSQDSVAGRLASNLDVGFLYAVVVFPLFLAGAALTWRRWRELMFLYGIVVAHTVVALVFFGSIRGRVPVEPVIAIFAAVTVDRLILRLRERRSNPG